jgi:DNA-directed RNA polymerase subunit RPC12/RpoP
MPGGAWGVAWAAEGLLGVVVRHERAEVARVVVDLSLRGHGRGTPSTVLASSPACSSCGRRALRFRKRTEDYVCRKCGTVLLAAAVQEDELAEVLVRRLRPSSRRRTLPRRPRADAVRRREVADALADMEAACKQLDVTVGRICKEHDPLGCLPFVLAAATGAVIGAVTVRSVRWNFAILLPLGGAALTWIVLMVFRVVSWSRQHPLLGQMYKIQYGKGDDDADFDRIALGEAIVRHYLPPNERDPLLARLDDAKTRTEKLLGLPS